MTSQIAVGAQLDIIGKYQGVDRTGPGFTAQITLDDADFLTLIRMAITVNNAGSSLETIQAFVQQYFAGEMLVFDYANMHMSYLISSAVGSQDLLMKPMGVQLSVIYAPVVTTFFGFVTYDIPTQINSTPFNDYLDYQTDWPWLSYTDAI